jgi:hypothetical protein
VHQWDACLNAYGDKFNGLYFFAEKKFPKRVSFEQASYIKIPTNLRENDLLRFVLDFKILLLEKEIGTL